MKHFTSYYAKTNKVKENAVPISISIGIPKDVSMVSYKKLAPSWSILSQYKKDKDAAKYAARFKKEILGQLDPKQVLNELLTLSNGNSFCLMCYEKSGDFCHRNIVSKWLRDNGVDISEMKFQ